MKKNILLAIMLLGLTAISGDISTTVQWDPACSASVTGYRVYYGVTTNTHPVITTDTDCSTNVAPHYVYTVTFTNTINVGNVTNFLVTNLEANVNYVFAAECYDGAGHVSSLSSYALFHSPLLYTNGGRTPILSLVIDSYNTNWYTAPIINKNTKGIFSTNYFYWTVRTLRCESDMYVKTNWTIQKSASLLKSPWIPIRVGTNSQPCVIITNDGSNAYFRLKIGS